MSSALLEFTPDFFIYSCPLRGLLNITNLPALGTGELNTPKQKESFLVGPTEPAGGGPFPWVAMALAGAGLAWLG